VQLETAMQYLTPKYSAVSFSNLSTFDALVTCPDLKTFLSLGINVSMPGSVGRSIEMLLSLLKTGLPLRIAGLSIL
jgi:hypothetical protein